MAIWGYNIWVFIIWVFDVFLTVHHSINFFKLPT